MVEILLAVIKLVLRVPTIPTNPPRNVLKFPTTFKLLLSDVAPVTPNVLLITVTPANKLETYPLLVEMLFVEILQVVIKLVLIVPATLSTPESFSPLEPTTKLVMYALLVEIELVEILLAVTKLVLTVPPIIALFETVI